MATKTGTAGLEFEFVAETNSLAVFWKDGPADHGEEVHPGIVVDYDAARKAMGIQIMGRAREFIAGLAAESNPAA